MPSQTHPQAQFVPISPNFDLSALVESSNNFDYVTRLSTEKLKEYSVQSFEALVLAIVIQSGKPLVISDWGESLPPWLFSRKWLEDNLNTKPELVRDIPNETNIPMTMGHYLRSMGQLTKQFSSSTYRDPKRQRLYLKDIDCPDTWANHLKEKIPECIYYLNDCIESRTGGDGAILEPNMYGQMRYGKGVAPAGDLMSSLPPEMRALNMMCYIGHEGTYTAAHREMCATLGHNIMVEASQNSKGEKEGSSVWFMTETKEREVVSEYFLSMLGHDIEVEKHFAQVNAWKKAPFNVWVVEQKVGDLILIPPLAPHQVWNRGTRTMKAAWNRTTVDTLELALHEALPRARMVCRDEQYKCKAIIYYTLINYFELLQRDTIEEKMWKYGRIKQLLEDFKRLFYLYQEVLVSEIFSPKLPEEKNVEMLPFDSNITCSYCRCNIFNRFLTCKSCVLAGSNGLEDTYDVCMDCYAMGRSCACISRLSWCEQWNWNTLEQNYEQWRSIVERFDGYFDSMRSPQPLGIARKRYGKKPIAEVCQEQLRIRPWTDITKPKEPTPELSEPEPEVDDDGRIKKRKGKKGNVEKGRKYRIIAQKDKTHSCHICFHQEWNWKLAFCTTCNLAYCYGVLWRAFDLMPQTVMEDKDWQCPRCLKICSCAKCRKGTVQKPYEPKGTLLGHDTRKVADYRSVESLVDFSKTNLTWLRDENADNPQESARMKKLKEKAEAEKARVDTVDESYLDTAEGDPFEDAKNANTNGEMNDIDPSLRGHDATTQAVTTNQCQSPHEIGNPNTNDNSYALNGLSEDQSGNFIDSHYEFDDYSSYNQDQVNYSSSVFAPVASMTNEEFSYPDPSHTGPNRMMGIGYYQQGNGIDQIIYDPPNSTGLQELPHQRQSEIPNLSLLDLLDPALQPVEVPVKKRKRYGEGIGSGDEDDVEFFTSKKQQKLVKAKKQERVLDSASKNLPRRSVGKPQTYIDLGEDAVPIEEDEGPSILAYGNHRKQYTKGDSDLELASQALKRLNKPKFKKTVPKVEPERRQSMRGQQEGESESVTPTWELIKTPRKSAWLARKEAAEVDKEHHSESIDQTRRQTGVSEGAADIFPAEDNEEGAIALEEKDDDLDSLFEEPTEKHIGGQPFHTDFSVKIVKPGRDLVPTKIIPESFEKTVGDAEDKLTPKRRGRPPKKRTSVILNELRPLSPQVAVPSPTRMLTLSEKLALKGKSAKIVAKRSSTNASPTTNLDSRTTLVVSKPLPGSHAQTSNKNTKPNTLIPENSSPNSSATLFSGGNMPVLARTKMTRPTIVRLVSPDSEFEDDPPSQKSTLDAGDSSDDIPAKVSSKNDRGSRSIRGRPSMTARRGRPLSTRA